MHNSNEKQMKLEDSLCIIENNLSKITSLSIVAEVAGQNDSGMLGHLTCILDEIASKALDSYILMQEIRPLAKK